MISHLQIIPTSIIITKELASQPKIGNLHQDTHGTNGWYFYSSNHVRITNITILLPIKIQISTPNYPYYMIKLTKSRTTNKSKSDPIFQQEKTAIEATRKEKNRGRDARNQRWCLWERRDGRRAQGWRVAAALTPPPTVLHGGGLRCRGRLRWGCRPRCRQHTQIGSTPDSWTTRHPPTLPNVVSWMDKLYFFPC